MCDVIREFDAATPVIFFTGEHPALLEGALDCPAEGVVMKPDFAELMEKITSTLGPAA